MEKVLFITNPPRQCGVHEMGAGIIKALQLSKKYKFIGIETPENTTKNEFIDIIKNYDPSTIIYNWHPATMPWLSEEITHTIHNQFNGIKQGGLVHDVPPPFSDFCAIIYPDPTFREHGICYSTRRLIPELHPEKRHHPDTPVVIGSFGFGLTGKGFQRLIRQTIKEFATAKVRLHIPYSHYCDSSGSIANALRRECERMVSDRIELDITHEYKTRQELIKWLGENTINCFFYDEARDRGVSSVIDFALAAGRPIAITYSWMFRHIRDTQPSICIENTTLKQIILNGIKPLEKYRSEYTEQGICDDYEKIVDRMKLPIQIDLTPNRVLSPQDRKALVPIVTELHRLEPDIMSRKFPLAVFQNAFNFEQVRSTIEDHNSVILIGGYEDPIGPALRQLGYQVEISDPMIDGRDMEEVWQESFTTGQKWDIAVSCSVLEHVEDDYLFLLQLHQILKSGGIAYLTTDFNDTWTIGKPKPKTDVRFYTPSRLRKIAEMFPKGTFVDGYRWSPIQPYFHYENSSYGFCSITMKNVATPNESEMIHQKIIQRLNHKASKLYARLEQIAMEIKANIQSLNQTVQESQGKIQSLEQQLHASHMINQQLESRNRSLEIEVNRYQDMLKGIGASSLRWSLGVARRISRIKNRIKSFVKRRS